MEKLTFSRRDFWLGFSAVLILLLLSFGFGYFFGRYEQILLNKSLLQPIPDVNCGRSDDSLQ